MDARERLRVFLEQRRELGESELVLDAMPVEDVLALLGASTSAAGSERTASPKAKPASPPSAPRAEPTRDAMLDATDAAPGDATDAVTPPARPAPPLPPPLPPSRVSESPSAEAADWRRSLRDAAPDAVPDTKSDAAARRDESSPAAPSPSSAASSPSAAGSSSSRANAGAAAFPAWLTALDIPAGLDVPPPPEALFDTTPTWQSLDEIARVVGSCTRCGLHASATQAVPGEGNPEADFVCVGEAPGQTEDETGRPFVGEAGKLLDKILGAIGFSRGDVFICNVLKHRPPGNRNPAPDEVTACRPFLHRQLALVRPKVILALGTFAAQTLLDTSLGIGKLRGQVHRYHGVPLIVTYHPAALLRNPNWKRPTWDDVQLARRIHDAAREAAA